MALNFRPYDDPRPTGAEYAQQYSQGIQNIGNTISQGLQQRRAAERQALLDKFLRDKEERDQAIFKTEYGYDAPTPRASYNPETGSVTPILKGGQPSLIERSMQHFKINPRMGPMTQNQSRMEDVRTQFGLPEGYTPGLKHYELYRKGQDDIADRDFRERQLASNEGLRQATLGLAREKEDAKRAEAEDVRKSAEKDQLTKAMTISAKIDSALSKIGMNTAGLGGQIMGQLAGSEATDLQGDLDTIKANLGFDQLMAMKQGSKNGASGLGALSENEMRLLTSLVSSLDRNQSPEQLRSNLNQIKAKFGGFQGALGYAGGGQRISKQQRNRRTGEERTVYSDDGGQTWHP